MGLQEDGDRKGIGRFKVDQCFVTPGKLNSMLCNCRLLARMVYGMYI